jgi:hypothetical protein
MDPRWHAKTPTDASLHVSFSHEDSRRALRRALKLRCEVVSHYGDVPEAHFATDVSPYGLWVDTAMPLHPGSEVVLGFRPPRYDGPEMMVFGTVTRVVTGRRRADRGRLGMAIEFRDLTDAQRAIMAESLQGIAPRIERIRSVA